MSDDTVSGAAAPETSRSPAPRPPPAPRPLAPDIRGRSLGDVAREHSHPNAAALPDVVGAAHELAERIRAAQAAGYRVQMGFAVEALESIAISATARSLGEVVAEVPVTVPKQFESIVQGGPAA